MPGLRELGSMFRVRSEEIERRREAEKYREEREGKGREGRKEEEWKEGGRERGGRGRWACLLPRRCPTA